MSQEPGFLQSLFDFSFDTFITTRLVKILYALALVGAGVWGVMLIVAGFNSYGVMGKVGGLVLGPLAFALVAMGARVYLEIVIVVFRIAENVAEIARSRRSS